MMSFFLDGSALAKRYVPEAGSGLVDFLLDNVAEHRLLIVNVGCAEAVSVLVRKKNGGVITAVQFRRAMIAVEREIVRSTAKRLIPFDNAITFSAFALIESHAINATDAILLRIAIDVAGSIRGRGDDLVLVASDQRLLRAARAEGLSTFDPETQDQTALSALVGP